MTKLSKYLAGKFGGGSRAVAEDHLKWSDSIWGQIRVQAVLRVPLIPNIFLIGPPFNKLNCNGKTGLMPHKMNE